MTRFFGCRKMRFLRLSAAIIAASAGAALAANDSALQRPATPFEFGAALEQCDGATDISAAVQAALDSGRNVYITSTPKPCVFGDVTMARADQTLFSENGLLAPKPGSDWLIRVQGWSSRLHGFNIQDNGGVARQMHLAAPAVKGDARLTVTAPADGKAPKPGQRVAVRLDGGSLFTTWVTGVSNEAPYRLELRDPLPSATKSGAEAWATFGLISVSEASQCIIRDLVMTNVWGGILLDDPKPEKFSGVDRCTVEDVTINGARLFALIKGRNAANNTFDNIKAYGGWVFRGSFAGDGSQTKFELPYPVYLSRELHIKVDEEAKGVGKDYDIGADTRSLSFKSSPRSGAKISVEHQTYGADGYVEDGRDVITATGGNMVRNVAFLGFQRCGSLIGAQLYDVSGIFDTCSEVALKVDGTTQVGQLADVFAGWAPKALWITGDAQGVKSLGVVASATEKSYQADGGAGADIVIDRPSDFTGAVFSRHEGYRFYVNSEPVAASPGRMAGPAKAEAAAAEGSQPLFLFGDTGVSIIPPNATTRLGPSGVTFDGGWVMPRACAVTSATVDVDKAPGAGQSHRLQLFVDGVKVEGAAASLAEDRFTVDIPTLNLKTRAGATLTIEDSTSTRALPAHARYSIRVTC